MEIDQDNLRTGIAIGCRASHKPCSNYLLSIVYKIIVLMMFLLAYRMLIRYLHKHIVQLFACYLRRV